MRAVILYDDNGAILSSAILPPDLAGNLTLVPQKGQQVLEVDATEIGLHEKGTAVLEAPSTGGAVRSALGRLRVDPKSRKLVPK